jgi:signal transduction histidine kinase
LDKYLERVGARRMEWVFYLSVGFFFSADVLRSILLYYSIPGVLFRSLALLAIWAVLYLTRPAISRRWHKYFFFYLGIQSALAFILLFNPEPSDFFALLFTILSAQIMMQQPPRRGAFIIALFTPLTVFPLLLTMPAGMAVGVTLIYAASNALLAAYILVTRRAQSVHSQNQAALLELQEANLQLQAYSRQVEQMTVARERNRLARELHDSVTQSVFSMTLATQSALLLLERDPKRVGEQLTRINELAQNSLGEMQALISELNPHKVGRGGLALALQQNIQERRLAETLSVSLDVEGGCALDGVEEQGLFRIAQESLNNIVKHARASQAGIRLHLLEPCWMEIWDNGRGFDLQGALQGGGVGLSSMRERAAEIGWTLQFASIPGSGTRIRVEKGQGAELGTEKAALQQPSPLDLSGEGRS